MGNTIHFIDNGWDAFSTSAKSLARSTAFSTAMFAVIHLLTLALAAIFYFKLHQKEFSIARAGSLLQPRDSLAPGSCHAAGYNGYRRGKRPRLAPCIGADPSDVIHPYP